MNRNRTNHQRFLLSRSNSHYPWNLTNLRQKLQKRKWTRLKMNPELQKARLRFDTRFLKTYEKRSKMLFRRFFAPGVTGHQLHKLFKYKNRYRSTFRQILSLEHRLDTLTYRVYLLKNVGLARFCIQNGFFHVNGRAHLRPGTILRVGDLVEIASPSIWRLFYTHLLQVVASLQKYYHRLFFKLSYPFLPARKQKAFREDRRPKKRAVRFFTRKVFRMRKVWRTPWWWDRQRVQPHKLLYYRRKGRRYPSFGEEGDTGTYARYFHRFEGPAVPAKRKPKYYLGKRYTKTHAHVLPALVWMKKKTFFRGHLPLARLLDWKKTGLGTALRRARHLQVRGARTAARSLRRQTRVRAQKRRVLQERFHRRDQTLVLRYMPLSRALASVKAEAFGAGSPLWARLRAQRALSPEPARPRTLGALRGDRVSAAPIFGPARFRGPLYAFLKAAAPEWGIGLLRRKVYWAERKQALPQVRASSLPLGLRVAGDALLSDRARRKRRARRKPRFPRRPGWRRRKIRFHWQKKRVDKTLFLYGEFRKRFHNGFKLFHRYHQAQWRVMEGVHGAYTRVLPYLLEKKKKALQAQARRSAGGQGRVFRLLTLRLRQRVAAWAWTTLVRTSEAPLGARVWKGLLAVSLSKPLRTFLASPQFQQVQAAACTPGVFQAVWNQVLNNLGVSQATGKGGIRAWKIWLSQACALGARLPTEKWARFQAHLARRVLGTSTSILLPMVQALYLKQGLSLAALEGHWTGGRSLPKARRKPLEVVTKVKRKYLLLQGAFRKFQGHGLEIRYADPAYGKVQIEYKKIHLLSKYRPLPLYYIEVNYNTLCFTISSGFDFLFYPHRTFLDFRSIAYFYAR